LPSQTMRATVISSSHAGCCNSKRADSPPFGATEALKGKKYKSLHHNVKSRRTGDPTGAEDVPGD
jgi:hypothetical protein